MSETRSRNITKRELPEDIRLELGDYLDSRELSRFAMLNQETNILFKLPLKERALRKFIDHVIHGEVDNLRSILNTYPEFLFKKVTIDLYGETTFVDYSPLELACYAHDIEMLQVMSKFLDKNGRMQLAKMIDDTLTEDKSKVGFDFRALEQAISRQNADEIKDEFDKFKTYSNPKKIKNIKSYNIYNLTNAYSILISNFERWNGNEKDFFWRRVVGTCQYSLPAVYAHAFCQGLVYLEGIFIISRYDFRLMAGQYFYKRNDINKTGLGYEYAINCNMLTAPYWGAKASAYTPFVDNLLATNKVISKLRRHPFSQMVALKLELEKPQLLESIIFL